MVDAKFAADLNTQLSTLNANFGVLNSNVTNLTKLVSDLDNKFTAGLNDLTTRLTTVENKVASAPARSTRSGGAAKGKGATATKAKGEGFPGNSMLYFKKMWVKNRAQTVADFGIQPDVLDKLKDSNGIKDKKGDAKLQAEAAAVWGYLSPEVKSQVRDLWKRDKEKFEATNKVVDPATATTVTTPAVPPTVGVAPSVPAVAAPVTPVVATPPVALPAVSVQPVGVQPVGVQMVPPTN